MKTTAIKFPHAEAFASGNTIRCTGPGCFFCIQGVVAKLPTYIWEEAWKIFTKVTVSKS